MGEVVLRPLGCDHIQLEIELDQSGPWRKVVKKRYLQKYSFDSGLVAVSPDQRPDTGCNIELTMIDVKATTGTWLTFGFEAFGPSGRVMALLDEAVQHYFTVHGPAPVRLEGRTRSVIRLGWRCCVDGLKTTLDTLQPIINRCDPASFAAMVAFIAGLNGNAGDHIGYFDTAADDIARSLRELTLPVEEGFRLAIQDGQIVGILGIEADPEIGRGLDLWPVGAASALASRRRPALCGRSAGHPIWHRPTADLLRWPESQLPGLCGAARLRAAQRIGYHDAEPRQSSPCAAGDCHTHRRALLRAVSVPTSPAHAEHLFHRAADPGSAGHRLASADGDAGGRAGRIRVFPGRPRRYGRIY